MAPPLPGLAIGGDYIMFVVTEDGIPSEGKHVFVKLEDHGKDKDKDKSALNKKSLPKMTKNVPTLSRAVANR